MDNIILLISDAAKSFDYKIAFLVFVAYIIMDGLYAKYTLDVANYNAVKAANTGTIIHFLLAFGVISYTQNMLYIFPLAVGSWIGTFYMIKKEGRKNFKSK
jgi:hypothetical protein